MWKERSQLMNNPKTSVVMGKYACGDMTFVCETFAFWKNRASFLGWGGKVVRKQWSAKITFSRDLLAVWKKFLTFFSAWVSIAFVQIFQTGQQIHLKQYLLRAFSIELLWNCYGYECCLCFSYKHFGYYVTYEYMRFYMNET